MSAVNAFIADVRSRSRARAPGDRGPSEQLARRAVELGTEALGAIYRDCRGSQRPGEVVFLLHLFAMVSTIDGGDTALYKFLRQKNKGKTRLNRLRQVPQCFNSAGLRAVHARHLATIEKGRDRARDAANVEHFERIRAASTSPIRKRKRVWLSTQSAAEFKAWTQRNRQTSAQEATQHAAQPQAHARGFITTGRTRASHATQSAARIDSGANSRVHIGSQPFALTGMPQLLPRVGGPHPCASEPREPLPRAGGPLMRAGGLRGSLPRAGGPPPLERDDEPMPNEQPRLNRFDRDRREVSCASDIRADAHAPNKSKSWLSGGRPSVPIVQINGRGQRLFLGLTAPPGLLPSNRPLLGGWRPSRAPVSTPFASTSTCSTPSTTTNLSATGSHSPLMASSSGYATSSGTNIPTAMVSTRSTPSMTSTRATTSMTSSCATTPMTSTRATTSSRVGVAKAARIDASPSPFELKYESE